MYDPHIHHRRSIRLKGYDYSQQGLYFVTGCVQGRVCLFGDIVDGQMLLNDAGRMVEKWYAELENKFPDIRCGESVVMPNHFHCIIENVGTDKPVLNKPDGADKHIGTDKPVLNKPVGTDLVRGDEPVLNKPVGADLRVRPPHPNPNEMGLGGGLGVGGLGEHIGSPLHRVVQWFKTMSTNEYIRQVKLNNWPRFQGKLWQRDYWEHIIRTEKSYQLIAAYIINNPQNWETDSINPVNNREK